MNPGVPYKTTLIRKSLSANRALKRLLRSMNSGMAVQMCFFIKTLAAN